MPNKLSMKINPKKIHLFLQKIKYFGVRKLYFSSAENLAIARDFIIDHTPFLKHLSSPLVKRHTALTLINHFDGSAGHNVNPKNCFLGLGLIHYALIRNTKPSSILCIGSRMGFIPAIIALACKENNYGHVHFVDAGYGPKNKGKHWSGIAYWKTHDPKKHFSKIGVSNWITTHTTTTKTYAKASSSLKYDYIYIDGDHTYAGAKKDYQLFWPKLSPNGFMLLHDITEVGSIDGAHYGVWKLWNELQNENRITFSVGSGLGIIQKNDSKK